MTSLIHNAVLSPRLRQFVKFCLVGGSGVVVDMAVLHVLAVWLGWNVALSKVGSAETAMLNNFLWNEVWTFREALREFRPGGTSSTLSLLHCRAGVEPGPPGFTTTRGVLARGAHRGALRRLWRFHAICGAGIGLAVLFLHLFHIWLGFNLYVANLLAIGLVTLWNFGLNARCNWRVGP